MLDVTQYVCIVSTSVLGLMEFKCTKTVLSDCTKYTQSEE